MLSSLIGQFGIFIRRFIQFFLEQHHHWVKNVFRSREKWKLWTKRGERTKKIVTHDVSNKIVSFSNWSCFWPTCRRIHFFLCSLTDFALLFFSVFKTKWKRWRRDENEMEINIHIWECFQWFQNISSSSAICHSCSTAKKALSLIWLLSLIIALFYILSVENNLTKDSNRDGKESWNMRRNEKDGKNEKEIEWKRMKYIIHSYIETYSERAKHFLRIEICKMKSFDRRLIFQAEKNHWNSFLFSFISSASVASSFHQMCSICLLWRKMIAFFFSSLCIF